MILTVLLSIAIGINATIAVWVTIHKDKENTK